MKALSMILSLIVTFSATAEDETFPEIEVISEIAQNEGAPAIEASAIYRTTLAEAKSIVVFEGLPHQTWDKELLAVESKRKDTQKIWEYQFYIPGVAATNSDDLRQVLTSPDSISVCEGVKLCGGYHPDYCISWQIGENTYNALVCFGCHEIVFYDGKQSLLYDLNQKAYEQLKKLLARYEAKRPKKAKD